MDDVTYRAAEPLCVIPPQSDRHILSGGTRPWGCRVILRHGVGKDWSELSICFTCFGEDFLTLLHYDDLLAAPDKTLTAAFRAAWEDWLDL